MIDLKKRELRRNIESRLMRITQDDVGQWSSKIIETIYDVIDFGNKDMRNIMLFYPMSKEVNLLPLLEDLYKRGKRVFLPNIEKGYIIPTLYEGEGSLKTGVYGIKIPANEVSTKRIDLIFTPLLSFTEKCDRLGRGKGYYDGFFHYFLNVERIGVAFEIQKVSFIPMSERDISLDKVITERKIYEC